MIKIIILSFIGIILDNIINIHFSYLFSPIFTLINLIFIYDLFNDKEKYFITSFIIGLIYDLFFSNFYVLNAIIFLTISMIIYILKSIKKDSFIKEILICLIVIFTYNVFLFLLFNFFSYKHISIIDFIYILPNYLINIIYFIILKLIFKTKHNYLN